MDFDTMFFISFYFVCFFFPVFVYPYDQTRYWMFSYAYNENLISKATALCLLGITSYMTGNVLFPKMVRQKQRRSKEIGFHTHILCFISIVTFILYIATGGYTQLMNLYQGNGETASGISTYFFIMTYVCMFCIVIAWNYNSYIVYNKFKLSTIPKLEIFYVVIFILFMAYAGSRGKIMNIILIALGTYSLLFKPIPLKKVIILSIVGIGVMFGLVLYRSGGSENYGQFADIVMDLMINSRNNYAAMEIADKQGFTYGLSLLSYILAAVPFAQNIIFTIFNIDPAIASSSMIITIDALGHPTSLGFGTTIIADLYLAFGAPGVVIMMFALGCFISYLTQCARYNIYALISYGIMIAYSVFLPRGEFFFPARALIWSLVIVNLIRSIARYRQRIKNNVPKHSLKI